MTDAAPWEIAANNQTNNTPARNERNSGQRVNKRSRRDIRATIRLLNESGETLRQKIEVRLEKLECTNHDDALFGEEKQGDADDEDYQYESDRSINSQNAENLLSTTKPKKRARSSKTAAKKKIAKSGKAKKTDKNSNARSRTNAATRTVELRRIPLVGVLLDEHALGRMEAVNHVSATALPSRIPPRRLCALTGALAKYRDAKTGLLFANRKSQDVLLEHPPPWTRSNSAAPYFDAMRLIRTAIQTNASNTDKSQLSTTSNA